MSEGGILAVCTYLLRAEAGREKYAVIVKTARFVTQGLDVGSLKSAGAEVYAPPTCGKRGGRNLNG